MGVVQKKITIKIHNILVGCNYQQNAKATGKWNNNSRTRQHSWKAKPIRQLVTRAEMEIRRRKELKVILSSDAHEEVNLFLLVHGNHTCKEINGIHGRSKCIDIKYIK